MGWRLQHAAGDGVGESVHMCMVDLGTGRVHMCLVHLLLHVTVTVTVAVTGR